MFFQKITFANRKITHKLNELLKPFGLNTSDWRVFAYLSKYQSAKISAICEFYDVDKAILTRNISKLKNLGLIQIASSTDKREKLVELSSEGKNIYFDASIIIKQYEEFVLSSLDKKDVVNLIELIDIINKNLTK